MNRYPEAVGYFQQASELQHKVNMKTIILLIIKCCNIIICTASLKFTCIYSIAMLCDLIKIFPKRFLVNFLLIKS